MQSHKSWCRTLPSPQLVCGGNSGDIMMGPDMAGDSVENCRTKCIEENCAMIAWGGGHCVTYYGECIDQWAAWKDPLPELTYLGNQWQYETYEFPRPPPTVPHVFVQMLPLTACTGMLNFRRWCSTTEPDCGGETTGRMGPDFAGDSAANCRKKCIEENLNNMTTVLMGGPCAMIAFGGGHCVTYYGVCDGYANRNDWMTGAEAWQYEEYYAQVNNQTRIPPRVLMGNGGVFLD